MKVTVNIECSPQEAREFFGFPDITDMQNQFTKMVQDRLSENMRTMEPDQLIKTWSPMMMQGFTDMQKQFWSMMQPGAKSSSSTKKDK